MYLTKQFVLLLNLPKRPDRLEDLNCFEQKQNDNRENNKTLPLIDRKSEFESTCLNSSLNCYSKFHWNKIHQQYSTFSTFIHPHEAAGLNMGNFLYLPHQAKGFACREENRRMKFGL